MNPRMPFYQTPPSSSDYHHNGYIPQPTQPSSSDYHHNGYIPQPTQPSSSDYHHNGYIPQQTQPLSSDYHHNGYIPQPTQPSSSDYHHNGYIPQPTQPSSSDYHHNGYIPQPRWNNQRPDNPMNNPNYRNNIYNRQRNWQPKYNRDQAAPYNVRMPRNRFDNANGNYYDVNGHQPNWNHNQRNKTRPIKSPEDKDTEQAIPGIVANKKKRKSMSKSYASNKWDEKDAEKALQAEKDFSKNLKKQSLIIRFPDPDLSKEKVQKFHPLIESVHFPDAPIPRYCFAHLEETANIEKVVSVLEKIPFGQGFLSVDIQKPREEPCEVSPKDIDPYTLYVGNLPMNVTKQGVIQQFPGCTRIEIGHPQQLKNTRYAFVRFGNVDDAIKAYQNTRNTQFESRSLIVRFLRTNGNVGLPGEQKQAKAKHETQAEQTSTAIPAVKTNKAVIPSTSVTVNTVPDLNLVKANPTSDNVSVKKEVKNEPVANAANFRNEDEFEQPEPVATAATFRNEDDFEQPKEEEDYIDDTFQYVECPAPFINEDDYDYEEDAESDLDLNDTFLPYEEDEDFY